ncbi:hypothetical protein [Paenibacillus sp. FSL E2-0201]|uniref:hypothetical protein n=1 Tax=Paenibacillus sp. FSL E2-0201 TaxID=2954726 RepID=UPI0030D77FC0
MKPRKHRANEENLRLINRILDAKDPEDLKLIKFYNTAIVPIDELFHESDPQAEEKNWFIPICNKEEINRIFNPQDASDYLLKFRAEALFDSYRLQRVVLARKKNSSGKWLFSEHFSTEEVDSYTEHLSQEDKERIKDIPKGFIFTFEANGVCVKTEYGNVIVVSEVLKHFFYYMNLWFFSFGDKNVPSDVSFSALIIAIRTMLETEAADFELDPRGEVPRNIHKNCKRHANKQIEFIFGHEIAHHLLNHLDEGETIQRPLHVKRNLHNEENIDQQTQNQTIYSYRQNQEFEADLEAVNRPNFQSDFEFDFLVQSGVLFFLYLDIFETVSHYMYPPGNRVKTHPDPIDRLWNLYNKTSEKIKLFSREDLMSAIKTCEMAKEYIINEHLPYNIELYENYGSVYLGSWRGKELIDRVDY